MLEAKPAYLNLCVRASDALIPPDYLNLAEDEEPGTPALRRRVVAVTEGVHNKTFVPGGEIRDMVARAQALKDQEGRTYFGVPVILDHSARFLDKVGATYALEFIPDVATATGQIPGAIADIEFWDATPIQREAAARVRQDPENTYFSIRFRGLLHYNPDDDQEVWTDMHLVHIAVVNEPADQNARLVEELSAEADFSLNITQKNTSDMTDLADFEQRLASLEKEHADLRAWKESRESAEQAEQAAADREDVIERASTIAGILQLDQDVNPEFLRSMSADQLAQYKQDLERRQPAETSEKGKVGDGGGPAHEDLVKKLMEG